MLAVASFLFSPLGRIALIGLVVAGAYGYGWFKGRSGAMAACQEAALRAELAAKEIDLSAARATADDAVRSARQQLERNQKLEEDVRGYENELAKRPKAPGCRIIDRDLRRLR